MKNNKIKITSLLLSGLLCVVMLGVMTGCKQKKQAEESPAINSVQIEQMEVIDLGDDIWEDDSSEN